MAAGLLALALGAALLPLAPCESGPAVRREVQITPDGDAIASVGPVRQRAGAASAAPAARAGPSARPAADRGGSARPSPRGDLETAARPRFAPSANFSEAKGSYDDLLGAVSVASLRGACSKALRGGAAGFAAGALQVVAFMWLRTIMNRQYYSGGSMLSQARELYADGGLGRFYQGLGWAVLTVPLSRFGDTFANTGVLALLGGHPVHPMTVTIAVSLLAALWRVIIFPVDTAKTMAQVHGNGATLLLREKVRRGGVLALWSGVSVHFLTSWACTYPWWATYNTMDGLWPAPDTTPLRVLRLGCIGACAAVISDVVCNALRVLKTLRQAHPDAGQDYAKTIRCARGQEGGCLGLLTRGLAARVVADVLQGALFSVAWKLLEQRLGLPAAAAAAA